MLVNILNEQIIKLHLELNVLKTKHASEPRHPSYMYLYIYIYIYVYIYTYNDTY